MESTNTELAQLSDLIGLIYEGATDPGRWAKDIVPALAEYIQAPQCYLFTPVHTPQNGGYMFFHGITQDQIDLYASRHQGEDVWVTAVAEKNLAFEGNVILGDELIPRERWLASKAYNDCFDRDKDMAQLMSSVVFGVDSTDSMIACCSFFRGLHHPDFGEEDRARLRLILPHLSRSLGVMQRLRSAELAIASTLDALDRLPSGILLLDRSGAVAFANRSALSILEAGDGLHLRKLTHSQGLGNLVAENAAASQTVNQAISAALSHDPYDTPHFSKCVSVPKTSGLASYTLQFSALGNQNEFGGDDSAYTAIIFIADSAKEMEIDPSILQSAYGLTPAETKVALALLKLSSAKEVAHELGTSPHTVRSQIAHIYAKLGVDTRARFVKLMLGLGLAGRRS